MVVTLGAWPRRAPSGGLAAKIMALPKLPEWLADTIAVVSPTDAVILAAAAKGTAMPIQTSPERWKGKLIGNGGSADCTVSPNPRGTPAWMIDDVSPPLPEGDYTLTFERLTDIEVPKRETVTAKARCSGVMCIVE
jgi:hypothetical protein